MTGGSFAGEIACGSACATSTGPHHRAASLSCAEHCKSLRPSPDLASTRTACTHARILRVLSFSAGVTRARTLLQTRSRPVMLTGRSHNSRSLPGTYNPTARFSARYSCRNCRAPGCQTIPHAASMATFHTAVAPWLGAEAKKSQRYTLKRKAGLAWPVAALLFTPFPRPASFYRLCCAHGSTELRTLFY